MYSIFDLPDYFIWSFKQFYRKLKSDPTFNNRAVRPTSLSAHSVAKMFDFQF